MKSQNSPLIVKAKAYNAQRYTSIRRTKKKRAVDL